ncbi:MAG: membrane protein [Crocinitomicaceae bacterium]|jgi:membrane protein
MTLSDLKEMVKTTFKEFAQERPFLHGAALSYYAILALIPLLYLSVMFFGIVVGYDTMHTIIETLLKDQIGLKDVSGITTFLDSIEFSGSGGLMEAGGIIALMFSCTAILNSLKKSINEFYDIEKPKLNRKKRILKGLISRLMQMVFIVGATVLVIAIYFGETIFLSIGDKYFEGQQLITWFFGAVAKHGMPILMNVILFSFLFKYLNDGIVKWKNAIVGAAVTGLLLYLGQLIIKFYLTNYFFGSNGGVAGTMLIILVWVYYSSQILFIGAKFTAVYSRYKGTPIENK